MARPAGVINTFEAYFQKADLDRDGKISGAEAVTFFQGSNLSKNVLAQIWMHADQKRTGFLGRAEFYNALKLVTVAQSGRELTPDLVRAALSGPASSQIPAPVIAGFPSSAPSVPPSSSTGLASPSVAASGVVASIPTVSVVQPRPGTASTYASLPNNQFLHNQSFSRPPTSNSMQHTALSPVLPGVGLTSQRPQISGGLSEWPALRVQGSSSAATNHVPVSQALQATTSTSMPSKQDNLGQTSSGFLSGSGSLTTPRSISDTVKTNISEGNGLSANSLFGDIAASALSPSTALVSASTMSAPSQPKQIQIDKSQNLPLVPVSSSVGLTSLRTGGPAQFSWPKMAQSKVQSYAKIFSEVDTDRDGKITGEQARNLFLSWKLPREVLKQVWDLSDQDDDSMLSLREFCIALYLMEQYREGRPLPRVLPSEICVDEALKLIPGLQKSSQQSTGPNGLQWQQNTGMPSQGGHYGAHPSNLTRFPVTPHGDFRGVQAIPNHVGGSRMPQSDTVGAQMPRKEAPLPKSTLTNSRGPILEMDLVTQLPRDEQDKLNSKHTVAEEAEKKVHELEKDIMDSKEKIAFYRSKLQELILYKTRCDNRINEITERAAADKREVEAMAKKYEEKYKLAGESNSRLASEEALFKDLQERKLELHNVIVRMEQGGNGDSLLQVRADRIQADLEELWKTLKERSKQIGLQTKPTSVMELPFGWQAPLHDNVAEWDDNWDKFQDEGFTTVQEVVSENPMPKHPGKANSESAWDDNSTVEDEFDSPSLSNVHVKDDNLPLSANMNENGSTGAQTEEGSSKSAPGSPARDSFKTVNNYDDVSLRGQETQSSNHVNSSNPIDLFGDAGAWEAAFTKGNDVNDSLWGFDKATGESKSSSDMGASATALDKSLERHSDNPTFDALDSCNLKQSSVSSPKGIAEDDAGVGIGTFAPVRTKDKSLFSVADNSVPSTPLFNSTSPGGQSNSGFFEDNNSRFDSFTRFDSFNARDRSVFGAEDTFANFDSFKGKDEGQNKTFGRFDSFNAKDDGHNTAFASFDSFTANYDGHSRGFTSFDSFKVKDDGHSTQLAGFDSFKAKDDAQGSIFGTSDAFKAKDEGSNTVFASFDSFKAKDDGHGTTLASFDSFKPKDGGHSRGFASFDDSDPFGSSGPFSLGDQTPKYKSTGGWSAF